MADQRDDWVLARLNQQIDELERQSAGLREERAEAAKRLKQAGRRSAYLKAVRRLRGPRSSIELWPVAVLTVGPIVAGGLALLAASLVTSALGVSVLAFVLGAGVGGAVLGWMLYRPPDAILSADLAEAESQSRLAEVRLRETAERLGAAADEHRGLMEERRALMASGQVQRAALLQRPWKTMPQDEWEDFVVEVFRTLGYGAERAVGAAAHDASLVVELARRRAAVVTQGEGNVVNSNAVQRANAGKAQHHCDACAVVINRRFTGAAQDFARRQGCTLVGVEEFPDFVLGKLELLTN
jgi:hypothetical protein